MLLITKLIYNISVKGNEIKIEGTYLDNDDHNLHGYDIVPGISSRTQNCRAVYKS